MRVMVIVKASKASEAGEIPSQQLLTEMGNYNEELVKAGIMQAGDGLHPSSKGVRVRFAGKERTVIDGPFAETKELIAGYWIWNVKSMDEAIAWLKKCPNPHDDEADVEIRPIFGPEDFGEAFTPELREQEADIRAQTLGLGSIRFEATDDRTIAGLSRSYTAETRTGIPAQWTSFSSHLGKVPGQIDAMAYGVCSNFQPPCNFDYLTGVEVPAGASLPADFASITLPGRRYVVFTHAGHVSELPQTIDTIWSKWTPDCGLPIAKAPCFERYTPEFNPHTGGGGMELWVPLDV
ncbi:MAG: YciI family protein [Planctomycetes bacterium]|nr:YciI family protein [Planctomycetota bacterium]